MFVLTFSQVLTKYHLCFQYQPRAIESNAVFFFGQCQRAQLSGYSKGNHIWHVGEGLQSPAGYCATCSCTSYGSSSFYFIAPQLIVELVRFTGERWMLCNNNVLNLVTVHFCLQKTVLIGAISALVCWLWTCVGWPLCHAVTLSVSHKIQRVSQEGRGC